MKSGLDCVSPRVSGAGRAGIRYGEEVSAHHSELTQPHASEPHGEMVLTLALTHCCQATVQVPGAKRSDLSIKMQVWAPVRDLLILILAIAGNK